MIMPVDKLHPGSRRPQYFQRRLHLSANMLLPETALLQRMSVVLISRVLLMPFRRSYLVVSFVLD